MADYWTNLFKTPAPTISLPIDFNTLDNKINLLSFNTTFKLTEHSLSYINALNENEKLSIFVTSYLSILHRRTQLSDLILASQLNNARYNNEILLRINIDEGITYDALLNNVKTNVVEANENLVPDFDSIVKQLIAHTVSQGHNKNANDITAFSTYELTLKNDKFKIDHLNNMNLSILINYEDNTFNCTVKYNSNLFLEATLKDLVAQIGLVINASLINSNVSLLSFDLVTYEARKVIPDPYSNTHLDNGWPGSITKSFDNMAKLYPERIAIQSETEFVTYHNLRLMSNQLALKLNESGIGLGSVVGIYAARCVALPWTIMGILKSGAAYTMMDPKYPTERIIACMDIAKPKGWISMGESGPLPDELKTYLDGCNLSFTYTMNLITSDYSFVNRYLSNNELDAIEAKLPEIDQDVVAVITFTSGTSGLPKGVMGRHGPLTHFYPWMSQTFGISKDDRFSMCSGIAHDPLQRDIFTALFFGALCCVPSDADIMEPGQLARWFCAKGITVSCLTPAMLQLLTTIDGGSPATSPCTPTEFKNDKAASSDLTFSLRCAFFVGDSLLKRDVARLYVLAPECKCINLYGSTETQRAVGFYPVAAPSKDIKSFEAIKSIIPVGFGMKDVDLILINVNGLQSGVGELAEIYMRSPHLAKGYIGLESASKEKFVENPFMNPAALWDRMYRTGDLGRYNIDGSVECIGRADDQVKIRGFRIELGEINSCLSKNPITKDNVTIVRQDKGPDSKCLVSYVVLNMDNVDTKEAEDDEYIESTLKSYLRLHLPVYMIPSSIVVLNKLPLTANGKINRAILPIPSFFRRSSVAVPRNLGSNFNTLKVLTNTQSKVAQAWCSILQRPAPSQNNDLEANFFDVGGHSLSATKLTLTLRESLNFPSLPVSCLLKNPTIAGLSEAIDQLRRSDQNDHSAKLTATINADRYDQYLKSEAKRYFEMLPHAAEVNNLLKTFDSSTFKPKTILLTGATGFLGAFLLSELLKRSAPETKILCLVRDLNAQKGRTRLLTALENHGLWDSEIEVFSSRFEAVAGDLGLPRLGLCLETFNQLAESVDLILHNGAFLHWLMTYEKLRDANVGSTCELLKLACTHHIKPFHHVSSTSVFDSSYHRNQKVIYENDTLPSTVGINGGYPQSKWVAEKLILTAQELLHIPVTIYRPGYITGATNSGLWNTDDFLCRLIKGCIQLQAAPTINQAKAHLGVAGIDMSPVDYVASTVAELVYHSSFSQHKNYHVVNPAPFQYSRMFSTLSDCGYNMRQIPFLEWRDLLEKAVLRNESNALAAMMSQFSDTWCDNLQNPVYDRTNIVEFSGENQAGVHLDKFPDMDRTVINYISYLNQCHFLTPPSNDAKSTHVLKLKSDLNLVQLTRTART